MPAQTVKRTKGLKSKPSRQAVPLPGVGGYAYPPGPYGATGFPGSTAAARKTKGQTPRSRRDRQLTAAQAQARDTGPEFQDVTPVMVPKPQTTRSQVRFRPGAEPEPGNRFLRTDGTPRQPRARTGEETSTEHRMTPVIGADAPGSQNVRNTVAQRYKARPEIWREYKPAPNPGKLGAHLNGTSYYHGDQQVWGTPDGKPIDGYPQNLSGSTVTVQSRYVSDEGAQEGYAMNRAEAFDHGGVAAWPDGYEGVRHIRGGRLTGQRYFGAIAEQQQIGLPSDSFGIKRRRGPNHRPVSFRQPAPHTANYYDVAPDQGTQAPDMIHKSPSSGRRAAARVRRG